MTRAVQLTASCNREQSSQPIGNLGSMTSWSSNKIAGSEEDFRGTCELAILVSRQSDWALRGEGGANVVLGYVGTDPQLVRMSSDEGLIFPNAMTRKLSE